MLSNVSVKLKISLILFLIFFVGAVFFVIQKEKESGIVSKEFIQQADEKSYSRSVIGNSILGHEIELYTFGKGETNIAFVGGIHGGYEWNSVFLAYKFVDYLIASPEVIPNDLSINIIPNANPDGLFEVVNSGGRFTLEDIKNEDLVSGKGRLNNNNVDLNRNFDCKWKPESTWKSNVVSAGTSAFSEPEARAIKYFVNEYSPDAVIFWHSKAGAVYASECENGILPETLAIMNAYARSSGYRAVDVFDGYEITGDAEGWLASIGIPAITVELETHEFIEWEKNLAGFKSILQYYSRE